MTTIRYFMVFAAFTVWLAASRTAAEPATAMERLGLDGIQSTENATGQGVRIVVLSETADPNHPHLAQSEVRQWRMQFGDDGQLLAPAPSVPALSADEWHGTHVAGTIAADCSLGRFRGVACGADLAIYDFGAYGDFPYFDGDDALGLDPETAFLRRLSASLRAAKGSDVANLSFNIEAPYVPVNHPESEAQALASILSGTGVPFDNMFKALPFLIADGQIILTDSRDAEYLEEIGATHNDPPALVYGVLLPKSEEWRDLAVAFGEFQRAGGVIVISESNNVFGGRSGVLNAMPSLSPEVSSAGWVSVVYVRPDGEGGYTAPLNGCGRLAADYCIIVRADDVLASVPGSDVMRAESGHSMAAPLLSGLLAMMVERGRLDDPDYNTAHALADVRKTARVDFSGYDPLIHGAGIVDATAALAELDASRGR